MTVVRASSNDQTILLSRFTPRRMSAVAQALRPRQAVSDRASTLRCHAGRSRQPAPTSEATTSSTKKPLT